MNDIKAAAKPALEQWKKSADPRYKNRWFLFFDESRPATAPQSRPGSSSKKLPTKNAKMITEVQKELDLAYWQTCYQVTNNSLGKSLDEVKKREQGDKGKVLQPLIKEIIKPESKVGQRIELVLSDSQFHAEEET